MFIKRDTFINIFLTATFGLILLGFSPTLSSAANGNDSLVPGATTNPATSISNRSAQLNGLVTNGAADAYGANTWFEWGTSPNLVFKTGTLSVRTLTAFRHTDSITDLIPGMTYYFRVVAENSFYRTTGDILSFTTNITSADAINIQPTGTGLGANAIDSGTFLPTSIMGWVILMILFLILVVLTKHVYRNTKTNNIVHIDEHHEEAHH
ncbi:MAG: fibronectin type III domain-containing protein [bacterium]